MKPLMAPVIAVSTPTHAWKIGIAKDIAKDIWVLSCKSLLGDKVYAKSDLVSCSSSCWLKPVSLVNLCIFVLCRRPEKVRLTLAKDVLELLTYPAKLQRCFKWFYYSFSSSKESLKMLLSLYWISLYMLLQPLAIPLRSFFPASQTA